MRGLILVLAVGATLLGGCSVKIDTDADGSAAAGDNVAVREDNASSR